MRTSTFIKKWGIWSKSGEHLLYKVGHNKIFAPVGHKSWAHEDIKMDTAKYVFQGDTIVVHICFNIIYLSI